MRRMIFGIIVGLLIGTAGTALAASDLLQAEFAKFNLKVNGEQQELKNNPIVVDGTTYWPLRELSEYLGFDITYEDATRTIVVNTPEKEEVKEVAETVNKPEVIEFETRNLNDFDTVEKIEGRIAEINGLIDQFTREGKSLNLRIAEAELGMLQKKLDEMISGPNPNEDPYTTIEAIETRLIELGDRLRSANTQIQGVNAGINYLLENSEEDPNGSLLAERYRSKSQYENDIKKYETEIAELEAKKAQLQQ